jgi:hypothetical protein
MRERKDSPQDKRAQALSPEISLLQVVGRVEIMLCGGGLVEEELTDCGEEGKVQCSCIEEQGPNYLLDPCLLCGRDWGRKGGGGGG